MEDGLQSWCEQHFADKRHLVVRSLRALTGGWENEVYAFDLEYGDTADRRTQPLILRIYPGDYAEMKARREFDAMRKLHKAAYPVPYVHSLEVSGSPFGKPFLIMERIEGELLRDRMVALPETDRAHLRANFCRLLVYLHQLDWRPFEHDDMEYDESNPYYFVDRYITGEREVLEEWGLPGFRPVLEWLDARRDQVPCAQAAVVHGDFHSGNVLVGASGAMVVIDWTGCNVSDPRLDLAKTLVFVRAYGTEERRQLYAREYERLSGKELRRIEWFEALACSLRLRDIVIALSKGPGKLGWRPEIADTVKKHMAGNLQTYEFLRERTGLRVPEVESVLGATL